MPPLLVNTDVFILKVHFDLVFIQHEQMYHVDKGCIQESLDSQSSGATSDLSNTALRTAVLSSIQTEFVCCKLTHIFA